MCAFHYQQYNPFRNALICKRVKASKSAQESQWRTQRISQLPLSSTFLDFWIKFTYVYLAKRGKVRWNILNQICELRSTSPELCEESVWDMLYTHTSCNKSTRLYYLYDINTAQRVQGIYRHIHIFLIELNLSSIIYLNCSWIYNFRL